MSVAVITPVEAKEAVANKLKEVEPKGQVGDKPKGQDGDEPKGQGKAKSQTEETGDDASKFLRKRQSKPKRSNSMRKETQVEVIKVISPRKLNPRPKNNFFSKARKERHELECLKVRSEIGINLLKAMEMSKSLKLKGDAVAWIEDIEKELAKVLAPEPEKVISEQSGEEDAEANPEGNAEEKVSA